MNDRRYLALATTLLVACGGESGGGGASLAAGLPPFCTEAMAAVDAWLGNVSDQRATGAEYGGQVSVGVISDIVQGMDALVTNEHASAQHQLFVNLMSLLRHDADLQLRPYLAESWELSEDGTELTFRLRDDIRWHDGTPTTAADVAFTFRRMTDPAVGSPNASVWARYDRGPDGVEVVDERTVRFRMEPHLSALDPWRSTAIMPAHILEQVPVEELRGHPFHSQCPVGNGPFVFRGRVPDQNWTFAANPAFPEELGQAKVDRYVYRVIPDQSTLMAELQAGGVDLYIQPLLEQQEAIRSSGHLELVAGPSRSLAMVAWNTRREVLADKRVRQAITLALDRAQMMDALRGGLGRLANGTIPPGGRGYDPGIESRMAHDPARARDLLTEAGWVDRNGDGVRENAAGTPLALTISFNSDNLERQRIAQIIQAQLSEYGIDVGLESGEWGTIVERVTGPSRDFDGVTLSWISEFFVDDSDLFLSDRVDGPSAFAGLESPAVDRLLRAIPAAKSLEDLDRLYREYQEVVLDEQPFLFLYYGDRVVGLNRRMEGVEMDVRGEWATITDWWIRSDQRRLADDR